MTLESLFANGLAGNYLARVALSNFYSPDARIPLVRLNLDPCDPFASGGAGCTTEADYGPISSFGGNPGSGGQYPYRTLNQSLTDAQEALLGCGSFWGTASNSDCELHGVGLFASEASALLESMLRPGDWVGTSGAPQPGTVGYAGAAACERPTESGPVRLPGCRGPADPGYDPLIDGCTGPGPYGCNVGDMVNGVARSVLPESLVIPAGFGAASGQAFRSEMSALSWNMTMMFVAFSTAPFGSTSLDALDLEDPYSVVSGKCSFVQPQHCYAIQDFLTSLALEDDPAPAPRIRWAWEIGTEWQIDSGTGDFAPFVGGTVQQFGPTVARTAMADASLGFLLVPEPDGAALGMVAGLALLVCALMGSPARPLRRRS